MAAATAVQLSHTDPWKRGLRVRHHEDRDSGHSPCVESQELWARQTGRKDLNEVRLGVESALPITQAGTWGWPERSAVRQSLQATVPHKSAGTLTLLPPKPRVTQAQKTSQTGKSMEPEHRTVAA